MPACLSRWTGFVLHWVAGLGSQYYASAMGPLGLRPNDVAILELLDSEGPLVQARLGKRLRIDKASMVGLLNGLERQGLIERRPHPTDGRTFEVHILASGRECLQQAHRASLGATEQFFEALTSEERRTLHELLTRLATTNAPKLPFGE